MFTYTHKSTSILKLEDIQSLIDPLVKPSCFCNIFAFLV